MRIIQNEDCRDGTVEITVAEYRRLISALEMAEAHLIEPVRGAALRRVLQIVQAAIASDR